MSYAASVIAAGKQSVDDLRNLAAPSTGLTPTANAATFLAWASGNNIDAGAKQIYLRPGNYGGWDFRGWTVFVDRSGLYQLGGAKFGPPTPASPGVYVPALAIGLNDNPSAPTYTPEVDIAGALFDGTCTGWNAPLIAHKTGRLAASGTIFRNGSGTYITSESRAAGRVLDLVGNYFASPAMNPSAVLGESHCEDIAFQCGIGRILGNLMDASDGTNLLDYVMTGPILAQGRSETGPVDALIEGNIFKGFAGILSLVGALQASGTGLCPASVNLKNNIVQAGTHGSNPEKYVIIGAGATLSHSGNRDYDTGLAILGDTLAEAVLPAPPPPPPVNPAPSPPPPVTQPPTSSGVTSSATTRLTRGKPRLTRTSAKKRL
jgi:hypothetical protein